MTQVSRMMLINNCDDPAMKYYDYIEPGHGGPQALGLCGPTLYQPRERAQDHEPRRELLRRQRARLDAIRVRRQRRARSGTTPPAPTAVEVEVEVKSGD